MSKKKYANDGKALALTYAEEKSSRSSYKEIPVLNKVSTTLRKKTLKFMKDNGSKSENFRVAFRENQQRLPPEFTSFMEGVLFGQLVSEKSKKREVLTGSVASYIMAT